MTHHLDITIGVAAVLILLGAFFIALVHGADLSGRGEVADAPEVEDIPHRCACGAHDLLGRPLPDPDPFDQESQVPADAGDRIAEAFYSYFTKENL